MDNKIILFKELADTFKSHGYKLYLVGGSVRDYLLNLPLTDMDLVTDATPMEEEEFLENVDFTFAKFGSIKLHYKDVKFDITTLRKESKYLDSRHPSNIEFTDKLEEDVSRRDLTINALYLTPELEVIDLVNGQSDINNKLLKMIGNPDIRIKEDPLRIVRIYRFSLDLGFEIDSALLDAIRHNQNLLQILRKEKIQEEIRKCHHQKELITVLRELGFNI